MKKNIYADYHIHSKYSDDSEEEMEITVLSAIEKGIDEICFTDHVDYGIKPEYEDFLKLDDEAKKRISPNVDYPNYFKEIEGLQEKYKGRIKIKKGLEFGIQTHTIPEFQNLFSKYNMDFVILSCHQVGNREFWTGDFQKGKTMDEYNEEYYREILRVIEKYNDYSILGHLDLIQRYNIQFENKIHSLKKNKTIIEKILKKVIENNKGIEVNTSSFAYGLEDLTPSREILRMYFDLGGKIITTGSDAHKAKDIGRHFSEVEEELKRIGFKEICTFEDMKPVFHIL